MRTNLGLLVLLCGLPAAEPPRVLLIGDSISQGYTAPVQKLLAGEAIVSRIPENGGPTLLGVKRIDAWLGDGKWDVIHFNFGLHDLKIMAGGHQVEPEQYEANLRQIVARLKQTGAALIFATTTPVPEGALNPPRRPEDPPAYNEIALRVMKDNGIAIDDLYGFVLPRLREIQRPANVHFTERGYEELAGRVAESIRQALTVK